jgi:hypothetical protein
MTDQIVNVEETAPLEEIAKQQIQAAKQERAQKCMAELNQLLAKYKCTFDVAVTLKQGQVIPQIGIIALD